MGKKKKQYKLRKHQKKQNKAVLKSLEKNNHVLYGAPTAFGKSVCIFDLVRRFVDNGERVIVIAPYRKLVNQLLGTFSTENPSLLMGADSYGNPRTAPIVVASLSTLSRRLKTDASYLGDIDKIIIDEAHISFNIVDNKPTTIVNPIYTRYWHSAKWIGFTATPITAGGYRLEGWDDTVYKYNTKWLIDKGWLSDFRYLSTPAIDTSGLRVQSTGDYSVEDMEEVTNKASAIQSVIDNYNTHAREKKTLLFAVSITHGELLEDAFNEIGVKCGLIHSNLSAREQERLLAEFENNAIDVLLNVAMLTTGFDDPEVEVLMIARPIGSLRLAIQVWGRGLRFHKDIDKVTILDLTGTYEKVGYLPDDNFNFNRVKKKRGESEDEEDNSIVDIVYECPECSEVSRMVDCSRSTEVTKTMTVTTYICPNCGGVINETQIPLSDNKIEEIKTARDIDYTVKYGGEEIMKKLGELIKLNTRNAKTSWGVHIHKQCMRNDKERYRDAFYGYAQEIYSPAKAWKRIMDVYSGG